MRRDGEVRTFDTSIITVRDGTRAPERVVATMRDVSDELRSAHERAQRDLQLQQLQKLESLGVLAGGIAHEFNNLLVGILGNASLAGLDLPADSPIRHSVSEIEQSAQRAAELTRQLLAYAGKGRFVVESVDCSRVVLETSALLRAAVSRKAHLDLTLAEGLPSIEVDVTQLRQALMNLISNASEALDEAGGHIRIETGRMALQAGEMPAFVAGSEPSPGAHVFIDVIDDGRGMDDETKERIFDPFFTTKFTGRGLGLAATLGIVRGHRGGIQLTSAPGRGTSVRLLFPAVGTVATDTGAADGDGEWRGAGEVLVVDDEQSVRAVTSALLQRRGFTVTVVPGGHDAVALVREQPARFALVLLDLTMPDLDGRETLAELRRHAPHLKVVLMSGYNEQEATQQFGGRVLTGFLQKPFRAEQLARVVRTALEAS